MYRRIARSFHSPVVARGGGFGMPSHATPQAVAGLVGAALCVLALSGVGGWFVRFNSSAVMAAEPGKANEQANQQAAASDATKGSDDGRRNVIVVTFDGFRRQEFFTGAEIGLCDTKFGGAKEPQEVQRRFMRETAEQRRETLLPFLWTVVAKQGQIFGDPSSNAVCKITNGLKFSYPGYNEMFTGKADPRIDSNNKKNNPNLTVLEFLQRKPAFQGRVAAFCTWDVFPFIFRAETSGVPVQLGWIPLRDEPLTPGQKQVNELIESLPRYWPNNSFDILTMQGAREHLIKHKPRVLYIGLGETDEWAHGRRYDLYLEAAQRSDRYLADLWKLLQTMPEYKDKTSLIVLTDHGRGGDRETWVNHDKNTVNAEFIWMATMGPDIAPLGVRRDVETTQSQLAATVARLVGENFAEATPDAAAPLPDLFRASSK